MTAQALISDLTASSRWAEWSDVEREDHAGFRWLLVVAD
jgi:hypothetical protein